MGVISSMAFLILAITSIPYVRRKAYWLILLGAIVHFRFIVLSLVPNFFLRFGYYYASLGSIIYKRMV